MTQEEADFLCTFSAYVSFEQLAESLYRWHKQLVLDKKGRELVRYIPVALDKEESSRFTDYLADFIDTVNAYYSKVQSPSLHVLNPSLSVVGLSGDHISVLREIEADVQARCHLRGRDDYLSNEKFTQLKIWRAQIGPC